ncbi:hypothetical protein BJ165DRAFT_1410411 [Panaeolus papilionaceus]|nr:hypothetical protein BJ165DRAFT_1410411 [Panaeolus papilionaceus]
MTDTSSSNIVVVSHIPLRPSLNHVLHPTAVDVRVTDEGDVTMSESWGLRVLRENVGNERKGGAECTRNDEIRTKTRRNTKYEDDEGRWRRTGAKLRRKRVYSVVEIVYRQAPCSRGMKEECHPRTLKLPEMRNGSGTGMKVNEDDENG